MMNQTQQKKNLMAGDRTQVIVFKLGNTEFAVPITQAVRIVRLSPITRVPRAPDFLEGVINVEGDIIPVVDLKFFTRVDIVMLTVGYLTFGIGIKP